MSTAVKVKPAGVHLSEDTQRELLKSCQDVHSRLSASVYQKPADYLTGVLVGGVLVGRVLVGGVLVGGVLVGGVGG